VDNPDIGYAQPLQPEVAKQRKRPFSSLLKSNCLTPGKKYSERSWLLALDEAAFELGRPLKPVLCPMS
jgi:hypothetical protein